MFRLIVVIFALVVAVYIVKLAGTVLGVIAANIAATM